MTRRYTPAQLRSMAQQAQTRRRQAVDKYNAAVRRYNSEVKKAVETHNKNVRTTQRAVDTYNREARAHNARVRTNQTRLRSEMVRLQSRPVVERYQVVRSSSMALTEAYGRVDADTEAGFINERSAGLVDMAEGEAANSARVANFLLGAVDDATEIEDTSLGDELTALSADLDSRWRGALFALSPRNPDAARHFCTSSREVLVQMLDIGASDSEVLRANPHCQKTPQGQPIRRDKINYLLTAHGNDQASLGEFIDADVDDVMKLFRIFNDGTHGDAGTFDVSTLRAIKVRVEDAIRFLSRVIRGF